MKNHGYPHDSPTFRNREVSQRKGLPHLQGRLSVGFIACVVAITGVLVCAMFFSTVRSFSGGGIRIEGPGGIRVEAQLGVPPTPIQPATPGDRK